MGEFSVLARHCSPASFNWRNSTTMDPETPRDSIVSLVKLSRQAAETYQCSRSGMHYSYNFRDRYYIERVKLEYNPFLCRL